MTMTMELNAPHPLERVFQEFEKKSGWQLSPQARTILREGYDAVDIDRLGMGDFAHMEPGSRDEASQRVIQQMPKFLNSLKSKAETRDKVEIKDQTIGGVFVLQNMNQWKAMFGCTCWPI